MISKPWKLGSGYQLSLCAASFSENMLNAQTSADAGASVPCRFCGAPARYGDRRAKSELTLGAPTTAVPPAARVGAQKVTPLVAAIPLDRAGGCDQLLLGEVPDFCWNWPPLTLPIGAWNARRKSWVRPSPLISILQRRKTPPQPHHVVRWHGGLDGKQAPVL